MVNAAWAHSPGGVPQTPTLHLCSTTASPGKQFIHSFSHFFLRFYLIWTILEVFIEFVTILLLFYVLVFWL